MKKSEYKRTNAPRLRFPSNLEFKASDNELLECNGKLVQVIPSLTINPSDNPPTVLAIHGIGKYSFKLIDADVIIFSFINSHTQKTDCAIIKKDELTSRLKPYHWDGNKINLKLILSEWGLHECFDFNAEGWFMGLWLDEKRDFSAAHNNWAVFYT